MTSLPRGVFPVLQTPFLEDDAIDFPRLGTLARRVLDQGADGLVFALASELTRLDHQERRDVIMFLGETKPSGTSLIAGIGAESTRTAVSNAVAAAAAGATAVMATPPLLTNAPAHEIEGYYRAIVESIEIPVIVQDASSYLGAPLALEVQQLLIERYGPERIGFKPEADPVGPVIDALRAAGGPELRIYEGAGGAQLAANHRRGLAGTIPGSEMVPAIVSLWRALEEGQTERAERLAAWVVSLVSLGVGLDGYLAIEKHLLVRQGVFANERIRGPVAFHLDAALREHVDRLYDALMRETGA